MTDTFIRLDESTADEQRVACDLADETSPLGPVEPVVRAVFAGRFGR